MKLNKKIIIPIILIGSGIGLYFLNKAGKLDKLKNLIKGNKPDENEQPNPLVIGPDSTITTSNPLGNAEAVKNFQKYYNRVRPIPFANLVVDGIFGPLTQSAYNSYKDKYAKFLQVPSIFTKGLSEKKKVRKFEVGDIFKGKKNSTYQHSWQLFKPSVSYVIDNKTNEVVSIQNTPYEAIKLRNKIDPNFRLHFKVYPKKHYL